MIWPPLNFLAFAIVTAPHIVLQPTELFAALWACHLIHIFVPLPPLFPQPSRKPPSFLHLVNSSLYDPSQLSSYLLTPLWLLQVEMLSPLCLSIGLCLCLGQPIYIPLPIFMSASLSSLWVNWGQGLSSAHLHIPTSDTVLDPWWVSNKCLSNVRINFL